MEEINTPLQENQLPRSFLRDLVAVSSLPELWIHRPPAEIATGLARVLLDTLYLDIIYVAFNNAADNSNIEVGYTKDGALRGEQLNEIRTILESSLSKQDRLASMITIDTPIGKGILQAAIMPIGIAESYGYLLAASQEAGFPNEFQHLLLRIAANQATVILRQKQFEEELRYKQQELTDFFENANEGLHWVGPEGTILWANQAELDMLGYSREEYIGQLFDKFHADAVVAEDIFYRLVNGQPVHAYEARLRCKDGSIKHVLINSSVYWQNGKFIHTRCFTRDITERKQMEEALQRAYDETEMHVQFRTKELSAAIEALKEEIANRKRMEAEVAELRARLSESRESERLFLAQELHDGPIQDLFALSYRLNTLVAETPTPQVKSIQDGITQVVGTLRKLCEELRPSTLISFGLEIAIQSHLEQFRLQYPRYNIQFELGPVRSLPERTSLALYRIYQLALANIVRHAQADQISVRFQIEGDYAVLEVQDNGRGFTVPTNWIDFAREGHFGLIGGFERAEAIGGKLIVNSAPGRGTHLHVSVPVH